MAKPLLVPDKIFPNNFDFIRFVLAASVIFCHSYAICYGYERFLTTEPFMVLSHRQISIGSVAVDLFFIISGFLILKSFESSRGLLHYLKKRVYRIYPGFITAYLVSILVAGFLGSGWQINLEGFVEYVSYLSPKELVHLVTLQRPFQAQFFKGVPEPGLNDSMWTIQFEFACYLLVPLLTFIGLFRRKWLLLVAFLFTYTIVLLQAKGYIFPFRKTDNLFFDNPYHYPRFFMYFLAGSCFYLYRKNIARNYLVAALSLISLVASFTWIRAIDQVLPIAGAYLLFFVAFHRSIKLSNFARHGDFSYGIYLYGWPVQELFMYYLGEFMNPYILFMNAFAVTLMLAYCSWHLVEKPLLENKKSRKVKIYYSWKYFVR